MELENKVKIQSNKQREILLSSLLDWGQSRDHMNSNRFDICFFELVGTETEENLCDFVYTTENTVLGNSFGSYCVFCSLHNIHNMKEPHGNSGIQITLFTKHV